MSAPDEKALAQIRKLGAFRPQPNSAAVSDAIPESVAESVAAALDAAPLQPDDPPVWRAHPYTGAKGLQAFIERMERQREWWKLHPPAPKPEKPKKQRKKKAPAAEREEDLWIVA